MMSISSNRAVEEHGPPASPARHVLPSSLRWSTGFSLPPSSLQPTASSLPPRRAFTLTELLIVITIIGMLASMALGALYSARQSARVEKTKATITKLDRIIQAKYEEFLSRRLPLSAMRIQPDAMAELKVRVLHEIMRMELPDRVRDITFPRLPSNTDTSALGATAADINAEVHVLASFTDKLGAARYWVDTNGNLWNSQPTFTNPATDPPGICRTSTAKRFFRQIMQGTMDLKYDSAECLYMIIAADPDERELFHENEIGDADGDGFKEFVDAWGKPIMFLRWAPGFKSELQTGDASQDPDPTNSREIGDLIQTSGKWGRGNNAMFRLVPLIYSAGPDGKYGINQKSNWTVQYSPGDALGKVWIDGIDIGEPVPATDSEYDSNLDNITNHSLGMN